MNLVQEKRSFHHYETLASTNAEALRLASSAGKTQQALWVCTKQQTKGRGRLGRLWHCGAGNFAASLLFSPEIDIAQAGLLSFVATLAVGDVLSSYIEKEDISYKWPNDVLVKGQKISGILLEAITSSNRKVSSLVVGIGINIASYPPETHFPAICMADFDEKPVAADLLYQLDMSFFKWYNIFQKEGFMAIQSAWMNSCAFLGEVIEAKTLNNSYKGVFEGINERGHLLLRQSEKLREISAADVYFT